MKESKIGRNNLSPVTRAMKDYNMIEPGDKVAVALSGGKDSLFCLQALIEVQKYIPVKFDIIAIAIDLNRRSENSNLPYSYNKIEAFCRHNDIHFHIEETDIAELVFNRRSEQNPCSLCSKMRNGALVNTALKFNCNKVALGHHMDDVIETLLMSMFYAGKMDSFKPVTYLDIRDITFIRPLIYMREKDISEHVNRLNLPIFEKKACPVDGLSKRHSIKALIQDQEKIDGEIPLRIFATIKKYLWNE